MGKLRLNKSVCNCLFIFTLISIITPATLLASEEGAEFNLLLDKAIEIALTNNLSIAVERINPKIEEKNVTLENAAFDKTLFADFSLDKSVTPSASAFSSPDVNSSENRNFSVGIRQALKTGANYELSLETVRNTTNSEFSGLNPQHNSSLELGFTQPLLKNFGTDLNTRKIRIATNDRNISKNAFKKIVIESIANVKNTYWDLVFKREDLNVKKQSLDLARDLEKRVRIQVDVGVLAPIEILQAQAEVAAREESVIIAENEIKDLEDELKTELNFPADADEWDQALIPASSPVFTDETFELGELMKTALESRSEIKQLKLDMDSKKIDVAYKKNQLYPTVDLVASFGLNGISGDAAEVTSFSGTASTSRFGGGLGRSLDRSLSGEYYSYDVGLMFEYPLCNRSAKSSLSASKLEVEKSLLQIKKQEQKITLEVKEAVRQIRTNIKRVKVTRVSKKLSKEKLKAEEKKFDVGLSTSFQILEFQKDLVEEQSKEIKAIIDYNKSIVDLHQAAGITLEKNEIVLE